MTYPQPPASQSVLQSQEFYRLVTEVVSPGEIYESNVGALALALGPNSDFANLLVTYYDGNTASPSLTSQATLSPDRSFIGRLDARTDVYPGTGLAGRILYSLGDVYREDYAPATFAAGDSLLGINPILDVIQYFTNVPSLIPQRSDKVYRFQYLNTPTGPGTVAWLKIPAYGRKSGYFTFHNLTAGNIAVTVIGVKFGLSASPGPVATFETQLFNVAALLPGAATKFTYEASNDGLWDLFLISLGNYPGTAFPITIELSDDAL